MGARALPQTGGGNVKEIGSQPILVVSESRLAMIVATLCGVAAIYLALAFDFESSRRGGEIAVFVGGALFVMIALPRSISPIRTTAFEHGIEVRHPFVKPRWIPFREVDGFFEKWPGGIGVNRNTPGSKGIFLGASITDDREEVVPGVYAQRGELVSRLNDLRDAYASSSMSQ
jgi:hypothetical protein